MSLLNKCFILEHVSNTYLPTYYIKTYLSQQKTIKHNNYTTKQLAHFKKNEKKHGFPFNGFNQNI